MRNIFRGWTRRQQLEIAVRTFYEFRDMHGTILRLKEECDINDISMLGGLQKAQDDVEMFRDILGHIIEQLQAGGGPRWRRDVLNAELGALYLRLMLSGA